MGGSRRFQRPCSCPRDGTRGNARPALWNIRYCSKNTHLERTSTHERASCIASASEWLMIPPKTAGRRSAQGAGDSVVIHTDRTRKSKRTEFRDFWQARKAHARASAASPRQSRAHACRVTRAMVTSDVNANTNTRTRACPHTLHARIHSSHGRQHPRRTRSAATTRGPNQCINSRTERVRHEHDEGPAELLRKPRDPDLYPHAEGDLPL